MIHTLFLLQLLTFWFFASLIVIMLLVLLVLYHAYPVLRRWISHTESWRRFSHLCRYGWPALCDRFRCQHCWQAWHLQWMMPRCWVTQICSDHHPLLLQGVEHFSDEVCIRAAIAASVPQREAVEV